jgi:hypothetical protein
MYPAIPAILWADCGKVAMVDSAQAKALSKRLPHPI